MTSTPTPLSPEDDRDFQQFTGVFDRPVAPCPAFAERLRQQAIAASNQEREHTMHQIAMQPAKPMAEKQHLVIPIPARRRSGGRFIEIVAAAVLVVALLGSMFWMDRLQNGPFTPGPDPNGQRLAAVTSPMATAVNSPTATEANGFDGSTSYYPDAAFDITAPMAYGTSRLTDDPRYSVRSLHAYGKYLIQTGNFSNGGYGDATHPTLWVSNIQTGELLWESRENYLKRITISGNTIYAVQVTPNQAEPIAKLVALSLDTGETVFDEPVLPRYGGGAYVGPVAVGDTIFVADATGTTFAIDALSGEQRWVSEGVLPSSQDAQAYGGSLIADPDGIFVITGANTVRKLLADDGSVLFETRPLQTEAIDLSLYHSGEHIIARVMQAPPASDDTHGNVVHMIPESVVSINAVTGEIEWSTPFPGIAGDIAVTPDRIYVPTRQTAEDPIDVHILNPADGSMHNLPHLSSARTMNLTATGSTGNTLLLVDSDSRVQVVSVPEPTDWTTMYDTNLRSIPGEGQPPSITISNGRAYTANESGQVIVLAPKPIEGPATPEPSPATTPIPDEATETSWSDPGHTNAYPAGFELQTAQPAEQLGDLQFNSDTGVIVGNTLILVGIPPNTDPTNAPSGPVITGIDLPTGRQLWSEQRNIAKAPVAGQDAFLTVEMTISAEGTVTIKLVSLSPQTGQINWEHSLFQIPEGAALTNSNDLSLLISNPIVIEDHVYIANGIGNIKALDTKSGEIAWQSGDFDLVERLGGAPFGSLVGNDDYLFVVNYKNEIVKYDVMTGDAVETFTLDEHSPDQRDRLHLYLSGNRLVVFALNPIVSRSEPNHDAEQEANGLLQILDSESGEPLWATDLTGTLAGSPVVANGIIGIPQAIDTSATPTSNADNGASGVLVSFYNLENGNPPGNIVMPDSREASVSASGAVICIHGTSPQLVCSDTARQGSRPQTMDIGAPYIAEGPPSPILFWNSSAIVLGHEGGPYIIRSGEQLDSRPVPLPATPQSSPQVSIAQEDATPAASPELTNDNFQPDYQTTGTLPVNLRWGPGLRYGVVTTISPETSLQYLGESEPTRHPEEDGLTDNQQWMKVRTKNGDEGWIREVDITKYAPQSDATPEAARRIGSSTNDPGQSSAYPAGFDTSHPLVARNIGEYPGSAASGIIVGDILIAENSRLVNEDPATFSGNGTFAQDLATGDILWRSDLLIHQRYTADTSGVYVLYPSSTDAQHLVALDLKTGEQRWASEPLSEFSAYPDSTPFLHAGTPIAMSGVVYVPFVDGSVMAFDEGSGDAIWTYMPETIAPIDEVNGNVSIAGTADRIYAANGANVIAVLDRQTGSLIREILLEDVPASDYSLTLHVQGDHLIVLARSMGSSTPNGRVIAVNPESGQHLWSQNIGFVQSNVLVSPTTVGIVHAEFDNANPIERLFGQESTSTLTLSLFDLKTGDDIEVPEGVFTPVEDFWSAALASSGNTICLSYVGVTCFDREGNVVKLEGLEAPTVSSIGQELLFWNDQLVILDARHPNQITGPLT